MAEEPRIKKQCLNLIDDELLQGLQAFTDNYNKMCKCACASFSRLNSDNYVLAITTPLMLRILESLPETSEIIFCDSAAKSTRGVEVFLMLSDSCCGGLPVGIIIATSDEEVVLAKAFGLYRDLLTKDCFRGRGKIGPKMIMCDDRISLRDSFNEVFPDTVVLVCVYNLLQTAWGYLNDEDNSVHFENRQELFAIVKSIIYSASDAELQTNYAHIKDSLVVECYPEFRSYIDEVYGAKNEWTAYPWLFMFEWYTIASIHKSSLNCMREHVLSQIDASTPLLLVAEMIKHVDEFYEKKLMLVTGLMAPVTSYTEDILALNQFPAHLFANLTIQELQSNFYHVHNIITNITYEIDLEIWLCSCDVGILGVICEHQFFIVKHHNIQLDINPLKDKDRDILIYICTGYGENIVTDSASENDNNRKLEILNDLKSMFDDLAERATKNVDLRLAIGVMVDNYKKMQSDCSRVAACHTFGKYTEYAMKTLPKK